MLFRVVPGTPRIRVKVTPAPIDNTYMIRGDPHADSRICIVLDCDEQLNSRVNDFQIYQFDRPSLLVLPFKAWNSSHSSSSVFFIRVDACAVAFGRRIMGLCHGKPTVDNGGEELIGRSSAAPHFSEEEDVGSSATSSAPNPPNRSKVLSERFTRHLAGARKGLQQEHLAVCHTFQVD